MDSSGFLVGSTPSPLEPRPNGPIVRRHFSWVVKKKVTEYTEVCLVQSIPLAGTNSLWTI